MIKKAVNDTVITAAESITRNNSHAPWLIGILIKATNKPTPSKIAANDKRVFKIKRCLLVNVAISLYLCMIDWSDKAYIKYFLL